jgi:transposase
MIRVDSVWMATAPLDMRSGPETVLMRVVKVFGAAYPHHAYEKWLGKTEQVR